MKKTKTSLKTDKQYPCKDKDCDKVYKSASALSQHKKKKHSVEALVAAKLKEEAVLDPKQEDFCLFYASDREMFGNGVQSYIEAYEIKVVNKPSGDDPNEKTYKTCQANAHTLLISPDILKRINEIYEGRGLNDAFVDKQLEFTITQHAELGVKVKGIVEYNKLKKRTVETVEHTHSFAKFEEMSDEDLDRAITNGEKFFKKT